MKINTDHFRVKPGSKPELEQIATNAPYSKPEEETLSTLLSKDIQKIASMQYRLYAENRQSLLIVLQGMDGAGKDGTIAHLMKGINPQGVSVHSFKHPSDQELEHHFLWRHYIKLPERGQMAIFNRSHYENVLITKVHPELLLAERHPGIYQITDIDKDFWKKRYEQIVNFEKTIRQDGTHILKFFLHISKEEQRKRFLERLEQREKHWKFSAADIQERAYWNEYMKAYASALKHTSTKDNPWYIIPSDDKWYARLCIARIILKTMENMDPKFPEPSMEETMLMKEAHQKLIHG